LRRFYILITLYHEKHDDTSTICTSSRVVAERPRDASCLSVVSFNSTIPRAQLVTSA